MSQHKPRVFKISRWSAHWPRWCVVRRTYPDAAVLERFYTWREAYDYALALNCPAWRR